MFNPPQVFDDSFDQRTYEQLLSLGDEFGDYGLDMVWSPNAPSPDHLRLGMTYCCNESPENHASTCLLGATPRVSCAISSLQEEVSMLDIKQEEEIHRPPPSPIVEDVFLVDCKREMSVEEEEEDQEQESSVERRPSVASSGFISGGDDQFSGSDEDDSSAFISRALFVECVQSHFYSKSGRLSFRCVFPEGSSDSPVILSADAIVPHPGPLLSYLRSLRVSVLEGLVKAEPKLIALLIKGL